ncbi:MAG: sugar nucleotide-binding protein, partial [Candidatus Omnitrophica bacterium]|nr:sugar nucleotide-binding protein [Candidatus Omnitrophota bacterium]
VINAIAYMGIESCEKEPHRAFAINTLLPRFLAEQSAVRGFMLVHFSTDVVFCDRKRGCYTEEDFPQPVHMYGLTKYGGECFIKAISGRFYIVRMPMLFGQTEKNTQFIEKMFLKIKQGSKTLKVATDVVCSPTYSVDAARELKRIIKRKLPFGVYHIANKGSASLYELMAQVIKNLKLKVKIEKASYRDFSASSLKNTHTLIRSKKLAALRPWKQALKEYCDKMTKFQKTMTK